MEMKVKATKRFQDLHTDFSKILKDNKYFWNKKIGNNCILLLDYD